MQLWPWVEHLSAESFHSWKICCNYFISFLLKANTNVLVWFLIFKILLVHRTVKLNFPIETPFEKWIALNSGFVYNIPDHKNLFWNFQQSRAVLCYILKDKEMLHLVFRSNIAPSLSSGNHLFYKAEYMRRGCPNQVWAITFDLSALATWNKHFWTAFW